jgi:hypothetical protein
VRSAFGFILYRMNYIEQINGFWDKAESDDLSASDVAVYFALLNYCNRLSWLNPFVCHWEIVCQYSKVSKNTYYKSMNTLHERGYIDFHLGQKNVSKPKVSVLKIENRKGTAVRTEREQQEEQKGNINKQINSKPDKPETEKTEEVWNGIFSDGFAPEWASWLNFRKSIKKELKGESITRNFNSLVKLSGGNEQTAIAIIDQSISQGWTGLFQLKQPIAKTQPQQSTTPPPAYYQDL